MVEPAKSAKSAARSAVSDSTQIRVRMSTKNLLMGMRGKDRATVDAVIRWLWREYCNGKSAQKNRKE